jgi:HEAT repeat protein
VKALVLIEKALADRDEFVRRIAARALGDIGGDNAFALIEKAISGKDAEIRRGAAYALGDVSGEKALALLEKALEDDNQDVRQSVATALGWIGGEKARDALLSRLTIEGDAECRRHIANVLENEFGDDPAVRKKLGK